MAKKPEYIKLTNEQKKELRRLTQLANRRIAAFTKEYEKYGLSIIPYEVSGGIQTRKQWATEKYAISRSTKFKSEIEFKKHMQWLRQFENPVIRETVTSYTKTQQKKTLQAMETALGGVTDEQRRMIESMSAGELALFWDTFSDIANRKGVQYSSDATLYQTWELFNEDKDAIIKKAIARRQRIEKSRIAKAKGLR